MGTVPICLLDGSKNWGQSLFVGIGVQIRKDPRKEKTPVVGVLVYMVVEEGFEPPTLCL